MFWVHRYVRTWDVKFGQERWVRGSCCSCDAAWMGCFLIPDVKEEGESVQELQLSGFPTQIGASKRLIGRKSLFIVLYPRNSPAWPVVPALSCYLQNTLIVQLGEQRDGADVQKWVQAGSWAGSPAPQISPPNGHTGLSSGEMRDVALCEVCGRARGAL